MEFGCSDGRQLQTIWSSGIVGIVNGVTEIPVNRAKLLKTLVGAWGFEPQTPTVSTARIARNGPENQQN